MSDIVTWQTGSGRLVATGTEELDKFTLRDGMLYILAEGGQALWVGTSHDLIDDQNSRAQFKRAVKAANHVLRLPSPTDATDRLCLVHDLISGHEVLDRAA